MVIIIHLVPLRETDTETLLRAQWCTCLNLKVICVFLPRYALIIKLHSKIWVRLSQKRKEQRVAKYKTWENAQGLELTSSQLNRAFEAHASLLLLPLLVVLWIIVWYQRVAPPYLTLLSYLHPEWRHLQAVHMCRLAGHLSVAVQAAPGGARHRWWLCQLHTLSSSGHLPLPGHAGSEAKILLCLDTRWVSDQCNSTSMRNSVCLLLSALNLRLNTHSLDSQWGVSEFESWTHLSGLSSLSCSAFRESLVIFKAVCIVCWDAVWKKLLLNRVSWRSSAIQWWIENCSSLLSLMTNTCDAASPSVSVTAFTN